MKNKKHLLATIVIVLILAALVYMQARAWRSFDWAEFWRETRGVSLWRILGAVGFIYSAYFFRALRWAIFVRPIKRVNPFSLIIPQIVGFTALGLLGRAGEFARPYLIARKEGLSFASQLAIWAVERVFDMVSVLTLIVGFLALTNGRAAQICRAGASRGLAAMSAKLAANSTHLVLSIVIGALVAYLLYKLARKAGGAVSNKLDAFRQGLRTIRDWRALALAMLVSVVMWLAISQAYLLVVHAYPSAPVAVAANGSAIYSHLGQMRTDDVMLMMCASMFGSMVQLPGVGGGQQLAVISVLSGVFGGEPYNVTHELAVSCGMLIWLVTFMSVIPAGLVLARWSGVRLKDAASAGDEGESQK